MLCSLYPTSPQSVHEAHSRRIAAYAVSVPGIAYDAHRQIGAHKNDFAVQHHLEARLPYAISVPHSAQRTRRHTARCTPGS
eukprot:2605259-Rhodomonas_salina.2